ncbi:hypothetical protein C0991_008145, partial [Blastosporella zonata]
NKHHSLFKFKIFGQIFVAISSPTAVSNLFRDRSGSFDVFEGQLFHLLTGMNIPKDRVPLIYFVLSRTAIPPTHRAMMPSRLPILSSRFSEELLKALKEVEMTNRPSSLSDFVHRTLYHSSNVAFLGADFPRHTYENFMIFNDRAGLFVRDLRAFAGPANAARESVFACWTQHFIDNWVPVQDGHLTGATDMISDIYRGLKRTELSDGELHRMICGILWSIHTNVMDVTIWVICHILTDQDNYTRVCREVRNFVGQFPVIDNIAHIDPRQLDSDDFEFLNSLIQEVLRTKAAIGPVRVATRDAVIMDEGGKEIFIRKGEMITINFQGMHYSPSLQDEPEVFKADRYMNGGSAYRSYVFGGGIHIVRFLSVR